MVDERSFLFGFFIARRNARPWKPGPRRRPKMPSTPWRVAAIICVAIGATLSWTMSRSADTATIVVRTVLGGAFGLAIGMYVVETVWERRFHAHRDRPAAPVGKRSGRPDDP